MPKTLYFIRHGQTDWNAAKRLQGQTEVPMNDYGRSQVSNNALKLADLLSDPEQLDYVASPICRARESMEIVRDVLGLPATNYRTDDRLRELNYGEFSTHTWDELRQLRPHDVARRFDDPWTYVIPKGESYAKLSKRVLRWFHEMERDTVVAAHAGVSRVLQAHCKNYVDKEVAFLDAPQDRILHIKNRSISWL